MLGRLGGNPGSLLPKNSSLSNSSVSAVDFPADGSPPATVTASINGNTLSWSSSSNDVVGYRIYNVTNGGNTLVNSVLEATQSMSVASGQAYVVVAVDITGLTSGKSNVVSTGGSESEPEPEENEVQPPTPPTNGNEGSDNENGSNNGNGSGNNGNGSNGCNNGNGSNGENNGNGSSGENNGNGNGSSGGNNGGTTPPPEKPSQ